MQIYLSTKADKQLGKLPKAMHQLLIERIEGLANDPFLRGAKKLAGRESWRLRVGDYRILYILEKKSRTVVVLSVAHRKEAYK
ncbi:MAG: plasmid stabilization system [Candidatus Amesbacteria bacterium GW2011_GWA2_47_11b]|uniref:Plasmid stabilization system n=1 Tax=Candidatus Amesbacteria bacterium GW2011_GWA2_47_11b TaxID=1618358 RepID=A0A0G1TTH4_9BACT|nr:MAG: plasmid stabilization system [Candidatus Amesbacteria bacterium GW2011_GWA2_47_11b]